MPGAVSRKIGTLHKLVEAAAVGEQGAKWSHVLQYLDSKCKDDDTRDDIKLPFSSPFPAYTVPSDELRNELWYDNVTGDSILRRAMGTAPTRVIAALCHLCPEALAVPDEQGRLPLHSMCLHEVTEERDKVMAILLQAHSAALIHRDHGGRTPLHYLFWYHAPHRTPDIVTLFCRKLPKTKFYTLKQKQDSDRKHPLPAIPKPSPAGKVPHNATIVHDSVHGCLPLHYAIMNGARLDTVQLLLTVYPLSKHCCDRYGRTALHWYLGAGSLDSEDVSGVRRLEPEPWWDHVLKMDVVQMLLTSRVARTADRSGRTPLHWAAAFLAHNYLKSQEPGKALILPLIQLLLDHHVGQICACDENLMTPVTVLFDTVKQIQEEAWQQDSAKVKASWSLTHGGPAPLTLPTNLLDMLLRHPDMEASETHVAAMEDVSGRLPLHAALEVAASTEIVTQLVHAHPAGLIHTTEDYKIPIHAAFSRPCTAPLQTVKTINVLLSSYEAGRFGTIVDGRLALRMEDSAGAFPIHFACQNRACLEIIRCMVQHYPKVCMLQNSEGDLPVHKIVDDELMVAAASLQNEGLADSIKERFAVDREKLKILLEPLPADPTAVCVADSVRGLLPLHIAVLFEAAPYSLLLQMLEMFPQGAAQFTTDPVHCFSALDLHELRKPNWLDATEEWHHVRELLFSFSPKLESHRHRQELLDRCVRIVIDELNGKPTHHFIVGRQVERVDLEALDMAAVEDTVLVKIQQKSPKRKPKKKKKKKPEIQPTSSQVEIIVQVPSGNSFNNFRSNKKESVPESMYDEEDTGFQYDDSMSSSSSEGDGSSYFSGSAGSSEDEWEDTEGDTLTDRDTEGDTIGDSITDATRTTNHSRYHTDTSYAETAKTVESRKSQHIVLPDVSDTPEEQNVEIVFDRAKRRAVEEEKKEEENEKERVENARPIRPDIASPKAAPVETYKRPSYLSEVAMRLWTFFVLYCDPNNPNDTYVKQVADIFDEVGFTIVDELVTIPLPPFATDYVTTGESTLGCFRDIASPKCRELIHKTCYFCGRYDFALGRNILVHRDDNGASVTVEAYEWVFTTQEITNAVNTGVSEAEIWKTGERPAEIGAAFRSQKRQVWIKFTKDRASYEKEVQCHTVLDESGACTTTDVAPLFNSYNSIDCATKSDRVYKADVKDARFGTVRLLPQDSSDDDAIVLNEYPFALVYPSSVHGTLFQYLVRNGLPPIDDVRKIVGQVAMSLRSLHRKGVTHGDLSMRNVAWVQLNKPGQWMVNGRAEASSESSRYLGGVTRDGYAQFSTGSLAPEMFVKLSPPELKAYRKYWQVVESKYGVNVHAIVKPFVDPQTGETYVAKCYFDLGPDDSGALPPLPYDLVDVSPANDLWSLGQILFTLCSGRSMTAVGARGDSLLHCSDLCDWSPERAGSIIYEHVQDPLAQDLLFRILGADKQRREDSVESVLRHPFFAESSLSVDSNVRSIVERRAGEVAAHNRQLQSKFVDFSEQRWLKERNVSITCWDFDLLERVHLSPSEIVGGMTPRKTLVFPSSFVLLPYKIRCSDMSEPRCPDEAIAVAESIGAALLALSKACYFVSCLQQGLEEKGKSNSKLAISDLLKFLNLPLETFEDVQSEMAELVSQHVEAFRDDPLSVAMKLVQRRVEDFASCFESGQMYLYLVDEYSLTPVVDGRYPINVPAERQDYIMQNSILFSLLCSLYARGVTKSLRGLEQLLGRGSSVPASWKQAGNGLTHKLDKSSYVAELKVLQAALTEMYSTRHQIGDDDLSALQSFIDGADPRRELGLMRRVTVGGASLWTSQAGVREMEATAQATSFSDVLARHRSNYI